MPLYEYSCSDCNTRFELLASPQYADDVVCVRCGSEHVHRILSNLHLPQGYDFLFLENMPMLLPADTTDDENFGEHN